MFFKGVRCAALGHVDAVPYIFLFPFSSILATPVPAV